MSIKRMSIPINKSMYKIPEEIARTDKEKAIVAHYNNLIDLSGKQQDTLNDLRKTILFRFFEIRTYPRWQDGKEIMEKVGDAN